MPRVHKVKRIKGGVKEYICVKCRKPIEPGQEYYHWTKYKQSVRQQHVTCGYPKRSQLSDSKMGPVWDEIDGFNPSELEQVDDIKSALQSIAGVATDVAAEYNESADGIEQQFSNSPTGDACREVADALESWAADLENWEPSADTEEGTKTFEDWLEEVREEAQDIVSEAPEYNG